MPFLVILKPKMHIPEIQYFVNKYIDPGFDINGQSFCKIRLALWWMPWSEEEVKSQCTLQASKDPLRYPPFFSLTEIHPTLHCQEN